MYHYFGRTCSPRHPPCSWKQQLPSKDWYLFINLQNFSVMDISYAVTLFFYTCVCGEGGGRVETNFLGNSLLILDHFFANSKGSMGVHSAVCPPEQRNATQHCTLSLQQSGLKPVISVFLRQYTLLSALIIYRHSPSLDILGTLRIRSFKQAINK